MDIRNAIVAGVLWIFSSASFMGVSDLHVYRVCGEDGVPECRD
jgi:hypothetical protein